MNILIGNTGLIGTTLKKNIDFDYEFNSKNLHTFADVVQDGVEYNLYLSCLPATKWQVNQNLLADLNNIVLIINTLTSKKYSTIYLFSTIDVYCQSPLRSNENTVPTMQFLSYGTNRYLFEKMVLESLHCKSKIIFRLPALFSKDIKKNILFDLLNNNNVEKINVNSSYQWYNLDYLYGDIIFQREHKMFPGYELNLFSRGVSTKKIVEELFPEYSDKVQNYSVATIYDYCTTVDKTGYIFTEQESFEQIKEFVNEYRTKPASI